MKSAHVICVQHDFAEAITVREFLGGREMDTVYKVDVDYAENTDERQAKFQSAVTAKDVRKK